MRYLRSWKYIRTLHLSGPFFTMFPEGHKCGSYMDIHFSAVYVEGPSASAPGWVMDYADIKTVTKPIIDRFGSLFLNRDRRVRKSNKRKLARWFGVI